MLFVATLMGCGGSSLSNVVPEAGTGGTGTGTGSGGASNGGGASSAVGSGGSVGTGGGSGMGGAAGRGGTAGTGESARDAAAGDGAADAGEASTDARRDGSDMSCMTVQCFRAINCVARCGGPIVSSGCCPCTAPAIDSIQCRDGGPSMQ